MNNGFIDKFKNDLGYNNEKKYCNITTTSYDKLKKIKNLTKPNKSN